MIRALPKPIKIISSLKSEQARGSFRCRSLRKKEEIDGALVITTKFNCWIPTRRTRPKPSQRILRSKKRCNLRASVEIRIAKETQTVEQEINRRTQMA